MNAPVNGYGLRYKDGLFTQKFCNGKQIELSEDWLRNGEIFQVRKDSEAKIVKFKDFSVKAVPYDIPITGYNTKNVNTIRLWQADVFASFGAFFPCGLHPHLRQSMDGRRQQSF